MQDPILEPLSFQFESSVTLTDSTKGRDSDSSSELKRAIHNFNNRNLSTPCPFPNCDFSQEGISDPLTESFGETQGFLKHLLVEHNLVIDEVGAIGNLPRYMAHWKRRFAQGPITDYCVGFWMDSPMVTVNDSVSKMKIGQEGPAETDKGKFQYFMLTDALPEDKELRDNLWSERLETILEINRLEREQSDFSRQCLFCNEICSGNRSLLFLHMAQAHGFHIGQPDNIVFVDELLDLVESQLASMKCICCEKTFKEKAVLKEHMRKKQHKRINPLNPEYDRFYILNYLESGKTWQNFEHEDPDTEPDDRTIKEEEWLELKPMINQIVCLFCPSQFNNYDQTLSHMVQKHRFDFDGITKDLDFYQKVKIVNFIRRNVYQNCCMYCEERFEGNGVLLNHLEGHWGQGAVFPGAGAWDQPEHFFPTYENDNFLMFLEQNELRNEYNENGDDEAMTDCSKSIGVPNVIPEDMDGIRVPPVIDVDSMPDLEEF